MKRITQITVVPDGEPIFSERAVTISIRDEAAGEFVVVKQLTDDPQEIAIDPEEWPALREAIDEMIKECGAVAD
jgi:hypothetical protein